MSQTLLNALTILPPCAIALIIFMKIRRWRHKPDTEDTYKDIQTPVTLRSDNTIVWSHILVSTVALAIGMLLLLGAWLLSQEPSAHRYIPMILCASGGGFWIYLFGNRLRALIYRLADPDILTIEQDGLTLHSQGETGHISVKDVSEIAAWGSKTLSAGFVLLRPVNDTFRPSGFEIFRPFWNEHYIRLPNFWKTPTGERDAASLCALLNAAWRKRPAGAIPPGH